MHQLGDDTPLPHVILSDPDQITHPTCTPSKTKMVDNGTITIEYLPNELLLHVFSFHRLLSSKGNRPSSATWRWYILAHVCQRWRDLIFSSLHHLEAHLIVPRKSPKTPLDSWPSIPISVWYPSNGYMSKDQIADVVSALEHSDRIREIRLPMTMGRLFWTSIGNKSFPELEHLTLCGPHSITLPHEFFGGSTPHPRLRSILLIGFHLPALPKLLLSSRGLVSLHLGSSTLTGKGFISPEVLSNALSSTTQLEYLYITCGRFPVESHPELTSTNSAPHNLVVLPALTYFRIGSFIKYLENFVSWINAPHLMKLIVDVDRSIFDVPQLSQFISRTEHLSSLPLRTSISLNTFAFEIEHHFRRLSSPQEGYFRLMGDRTDYWQVSQVVHICAQLSPFAWSVKQLKLSVSHLPPTLRGKTDPAPWLQLLSPYNNIEDIEIFGQGAPCTGFACALQQSTWEMAQEVLPALRVLRIHGFDFRSIRLMMLFAAARRLNSRPVIVYCLDEDAG